MLRKRRLHALMGAFLAVASPMYAETPVEEPKEVQAEIDIKKLSEAFGNFIGKNLKGSGLNFDIPNLIQGIQNGSEGKPSPLTDKEYEKGMRDLQEKAIKKLTEDNLKAANAFLEANKSKPNIVIVEPGKLQYKILSPGTGEVVKEHGTPMIKYKGSYIDGTVFGNSDDAGGSINLPLDQTIPGFSKSIVGMKEGEKRQIFIHPDLGYGTTGHLPPNSLLIFEVEVIKAEAPQPTEDETSQNDGSDEDESSDEDETPPIAELDIKATKLANAPSSKTPASKSPSDEDSDEEDDDTYDDDEDYEDEDEDDDVKPTPKSKK